ncbi:hypothetical protein [Methylobacterium haplocladii]|nr:hypothetical protein [Methylobacterium haplocladii]
MAALGAATERRQVVDRLAAQRGAVAPVVNLKIVGGIAAPAAESVEG